MKNKNQIVEYMKNGCKQDSNSYLGLELEHFIVKKDTKEAVSFYEEKGVEHILKIISNHFDEKIISNGHLIGLNSPNIAISLEPGAQFEISIKQQNKIQNIESIYRDFVQMLDPILEELNYEMVYLGYQPKTKVDDIMILPKERYHYMDMHFKTSGTCGKNMMRGTAATQVSIDYKNEEEFVIKYRAGNILGPILAMITDNCPVFEGELYHGNMLRQYIWENVDSERTGTVPSLFDPNFGFEEYAEYISHVPQIVHEDRYHIMSYTQATSEELFQDRELNKQEIEQILSMVFPDVRAKQYIEIRVADSMPLEYVLSYLSLVKGLFADVKRLEKFLDKLNCQDIHDIRNGKMELSQKGYEGMIYNMPVATILEEMLEMAYDNLEAEESQYLLPLKKLANNRRTVKEI